MKERPILFSVSPGQRYRARHRDAINARKRARYQERREHERARQQAYRVTNAEKVNEYNAEWSRGYRARLRSEFLAAYGGACSCCGETEPLFLQLDHVNNDGAAHRRAFKTGAKLLAQLKREGWPRDRYRLLCANCNFGRALNGGVCPHVNDPS